MNTEQKTEELGVNNEEFKRVDELLTYVINVMSVAINESEKKTYIRPILFFLLAVIACIILSLTSISMNTALRLVTMSINLSWTLCFAVVFVMCYFLVLSIGHLLKPLSKREIPFWQQMKELMEELKLLLHDSRDETSLAVGKYHAISVANNWLTKIDASIRNDVVREMLSKSETDVLYYLVINGLSIDGYRDWNLDKVEVEIQMGKKLLIEKEKIFKDLKE